MNSNNRQNFRPSVREIEDVTRDARRDGRRGALAGGLIGGALGRIAGKKKLAATAAGAIAGGIVGRDAGRQIGRRQGARDVVQSRKALQNSQLAELRDQVNEMMDRMAAHDFETVDGATAAKPISGVPNRLPRRPSVRGMRSAPGNGASAEALFAEAREDIASRWGWGIASSLADDELDDEHAEALHDAIMAEIQRTDSPSAGVKRGEDFERKYFEAKLGPAAVARMGKAELHALFVAHQRNGTIELDDQDATTALAILTRERTDTGQFAPEGQTDSLAVQAAYSPRRRTGISPSVDPDSAAEGLATATRHARKLRKAKIRGVTGGIPTLPGADFARASDDDHTARNAAMAGTAGAGLTIAGLLAARRLRRGRVPRLKSGTPALPPRTSPPTYDVETQVMSRRLPLLTQLAMGKVGTYKIRRANLKGKRPPTGIHPRQLGKAKPKNFGFLIHDPDFPLVPMKQPKLAPGMRQRVKPAKSRAEVLKRLRGMTQLSIGSAVAEGAIDALGIGEATTPKRKKVMVDSRGNVLAPPQQLTDPGTTSTASFDSAIARLIELGYGDAIVRGAGRFAPEVGAIAAGDIAAESLHDRILDAREKKKRRARLQIRGGIEATSPAGPQTMSEILGVVTEFDHGNERVAQAKRKGTSVAAAGAGGVAGAIGGLKYDQGSPVAHSDLKPGDKIYRRFGPGGVFQHAGVVDEAGNIVHRTSGSSKYRSIKPDSWRKVGRSPTYREPSDLPRGRLQRTRAGPPVLAPGNTALAPTIARRPWNALPARGGPSPVNSAVLASARPSAHLEVRLSPQS